MPPKVAKTPQKNVENLEQYFFCGVLLHFFTIYCEISKRKNFRRFVTVSKRFDPSKTFYSGTDKFLRFETF